MVIQKVLIIEDTDKIFGDRLHN